MNRDPNGFQYFSLTDNMTLPFQLCFPDNQQFTATFLSQPDPVCSNQDTGINIK